MSRGFVIGAAPFRARHGAMMPGWRHLRDAMAELPKRATHRWSGYDYAQRGAYYLTICTQDRLHLFGRVADGVMHPSPIGVLARQCWNAIPHHMPHVDIGEFVVMPNHVHGIVVVRERLVDVRGVVGGGALDVGARHDAPGIGAMDAHDTTTNAPGIGAGDAFRETTITNNASSDDPGTGMPGDDPDASDAHGPRTRARHDAPGIGAGDAFRETTITNNASSDDPGTGMPGDDSDASDAHGPRTRARHDAPLRDPRKPPGIPRGALGQIVASFKSAVTRLAYRDGLLPRGTPLWQRNYWDRVIRDDGEHERITKYIRDNPTNWKGDRFNR